MKYIFRSFIVALVFCSTTFYGQQMLRGVILDNNQPLEGVVIYEKGGSNMTISNSDGTFEMTDVSENDVLLIDQVGYDSQYITVAKLDTELTVELTKNTAQRVEIGTVSKSIKKEQKKVSGKKQVYVVNGQKVDNIDYLFTKRIENVEVNSSSNTEDVISLTLR